MNPSEPRSADHCPAEDAPTTEAMRERAYRQLRRLLILQQIPSGRRLREAEWTAKLKVNRSALREAFARLEAQGLIEAGTKTGYIVPALDRKNIREILAVRTMLETGAVEIVCACGLNTAEHLDAMRQACDEMDRMAAANDLVAVAEADWSFHRALIEASGNKRLRSVYQHAPLPLILPEHTSGPKWQEAVRQTVNEHRTLLATILQGDTEKAVELLRKHITIRSLDVAQTRPD